MKMTTVHSTQFFGKCPLGCVDIYFAEFTVISFGAGARVLMVEDIQHQIDRLTETECTQEQLTYSLASALNCRVKTTGTHSRFQTVCVAEFDDLNK